jgi:transcriptional regulator with XRE-family HTH domain
MTSLNNTIGEAIKSARLLKNFSQFKLSQLTGFEQPHISAWERGARNPNKESLQALSDVLGIDFLSIEFEGEKYLLKNAISNKDILDKLNLLEVKIDQILNGVHICIERS